MPVSSTGSVFPEAMSKRLTHPERGELESRVIVETTSRRDLNHLRKSEAICHAVRARRGAAPFHQTARVSIFVRFGVRLMTDVSSTASKLRLGHPVGALRSAESHSVSSVANVAAACVP